MTQPKTERPPRLPLKLHVTRLLATLAVVTVFRWRRFTRLKLFRAAMGAVFGRLAPRYEDLWKRAPGGWATATTPLREALGDRILGGPPRRVLDVACGTARASSVVTEHFPEADLFGLDLAPAMLRKARAIWPESLPPLHLLVGDAGCPPFAPGSFDLVVVMNAPPEPEAVRELLAPKGRAIFAYSMPYAAAVRPHVRRRLLGAGFALVTARPSGLGVLIIAALDREL